MFQVDWVEQTLSFGLILQFDMEIRISDSFVSMQVNSKEWWLEVDMYTIWPQGLLLSSCIHSFGAIMTFDAQGQVNM